MTYSRTRTWICFLQIFNIGLLQSGSCKLFADANSNKNGTMIDDWNKLIPSSSLNWTPCFNDYNCTRLEVPLDYGSPEIGNTSIALMRLSAQSGCDDVPNILINQGGPGGSGVQFLMEEREPLVQLLGSNYNLIGFDPRGVGNSGPVVDCFPKNPSARKAFRDVFYSIVTDSSDDALQQQYAASDIYGKWCSEAFKSDPSGQYVSTPAVARDMMSYIVAEQVASGQPEGDARLWYYAVSYGTVLGSTFAAMFPDNIGRMIVDGVLDVEDYYNLGWKTNLYRADAAMDTFSTYCHQAGAKNCSFWGPSAENISHRLNNILKSLKNNPLPVTGLDSSSSRTGLATYADLKELMLSSLYTPIASFPSLADALLELENGNGSLIVGGTDFVSNESDDTDTHDVDTIVKCVDGYQRTNFDTAQDYKDYVKDLTHQSKYFGDAWPVSSDTVLCRSLELNGIKGRSFSGFTNPPTYKTSFPILFTCADPDPVTPCRGAYKMSKIFHGSTVLKQTSVGHTASASASGCLTVNFQSYLAGEVPKFNTICQPDRIPFRDS